MMQTSTRGKIYFALLKSWEAISLQIYVCPWVTREERVAQHPNGKELQRSRNLERCKDLGFFLSELFWSSNAMSVKTFWGLLHKPMKRLIFGGAVQWLCHLGTESNLGPSRGLPGAMWWMDTWHGTPPGVSGTVSPCCAKFSVHISWNLSIYIKVCAFGTKAWVTFITFHQQMFLEPLPCPRHWLRHLVVQCWSTALKRIKYKVMSTCEFCKEQKIKQQVSLGPRSLLGLS